MIEAKRGFDEFNKVSATSKIVATDLGNAVSRVIVQFGRRMFNKALQEAKQFVLEFDNAMTTIQMITLKTDEEIAKRGDSLIQTSLDMKVSVSDVTSAAADLW